MKKDKLIITLFLILIAAATVYKIVLIHSLPVQADELYALARTCNHSVYQTAINCSLDNTKIYPLDELLTVFTAKSQPVNFIQDSLYYLQNFYKLSNHPPLAEILGKLAIINNQIGIINLRYLAFIDWFISLFVIYLVFKELKLEKKTILTTLIFYSAFSLTSLTASFAKAYSLQVLTCWLTLLLYLKTTRRLGFWSKHLPPILALHAAFLTHYFSIFILLPWLILLDLSKKNILRAFAYSASLCIYLPIIKIQTQQTSDYFSGRYSLVAEIKNLYKLLLNLYGLNFRGLLVYLIVIALVVLFFQSKKQKPILYFFLFSLAPSLILMGYDIATDRHMLGMLRYSVAVLPFVALIWTLILNNNIYKTVLFSGLLLINMAIPRLTSKHCLNEGAVVNYDQYVNSENFKGKSLILVPRYSITILTVLQGIQAKLIGRSSLEALKLNNNQNIYVASRDSINKTTLDQLISKQQIKNIYVFPGPSEVDIYKDLDLNDYKYKVFQAKYQQKLLKF